MKKVFKDWYGNSVEFGDVITLSWGTGDGGNSTTVTKDNVKTLCDLGLIKVEECLETSDVFKFLTKKHPDAIKTLYNLYKINESAVFDTYLKAIAILLDNGYESHINKCPYFYFISKVDGTINKVCNSNLNENFFKNLSLFRTYSDAEFALELVRNIFEEVYKNE